MRALLYPEFDVLRMAEVDDAPLLPDEVRLAVAACGICGSELEAFSRRSPRRPPPLVMGHEYSGTIVEVGRAVRGWATGDEVVGNALVPCGRCRRCVRGDEHLCADRQIVGMHRPGAFAERVTVPARCLVHRPASLDADVAAMAEPAGNGVHVVNLTRRFPADTAVVIGAGPIGLFCQQALQVLRGARVVSVDLVAERRAISKRLGAQRSVDPRGEDAVAYIRDWTDGEGADVVVDAVGSAVTKRQSIDMLRPGGVAVWIGLHESEMTFASYGITLGERCVLGSYAAQKAELEVALGLFADGRIEATSWMKTFPLDDGVAAFHRMLAAEGDDVKGVLKP
ncbi:galactitol-1-phosphate 5-dehydrogenase [Opitutales bacterium ASA1]|uniref:zinc-dependent alcohol dehydrogenase n=1 Tax=Congregicoccus parvus TaxID=3081749 RepID=UPI002B313030|nr:galactitol-1-phosphate 5-dehydrogenase [Opitutales bacterium ASA1]